MAHGTFSGKTGNQNSPKAFGESKKPDKMVCLGWHVPICKYNALHGKANWPTSGDGATDKFISDFLKIFFHLLYYTYSLRNLMYFFADIKQISYRLS